MLERMGASVIGALMNGMKIVLGVVVLIALIRWAKANPDQAQALLNKAMTTAAALINWVFNEINTMVS